MSNTSSLETNYNTLNDIATELQSVKNKFPQSFKNSFPEAVGTSSVVGGGLKSNDNKWKSPYDAGVKCIETASKELKLAYDALDKLIKNCSNASYKVEQTDRNNLKETIAKKLRIQDPNADESVIDTFASLVVAKIYDSAETGATVSVNGTISGWYKYDATTGDLNVGLTDSENEGKPEGTTEVKTETPTETKTETPTEVKTETKTEAPTDAKTEAPTETKTEAPTEVKTEAPKTSAPTEVKTEAPKTEAPQTSAPQTSAPSGNTNTQENNTNTNTGTNTNTNQNTGAGTNGTSTSVSADTGTKYETDNATLEGLETTSKTTVTDNGTYKNKTTTMSASVKVTPKKKETTGGVTKTAGIIAGAAAVPVVGLAASAVHNKVKENNELDLDEDRPTNGNKFWSDKKSNVINSEEDIFNMEDLK